jgi:hypothetical protein
MQIENGLETEKRNLGKNMKFRTENGNVQKFPDFEKSAKNERKRLRS